MMLLANDGLVKVGKEACYFINFILEIHFIVNQDKIITVP